MFLTEFYKKQGVTTAMVFRAARWEEEGSWDPPHVWPHQQRSGWDPQQQSFETEVQGAWIIKAAKKYVRADLYPQSWPAGGGEDKMEL